MALTARELVRLLVGDRKKSAVKENIGTGDGANKTFIFDMFPVATDTVTLYLTGSAQASAAATIDHDTGKIVFSAAPSDGHTLLGDYDYYALSDDEIDDVMSGIGTGNIYLVAANCALALAADASRWFSYTMGDKTVNKNDVGRKLLELSRELENRYYTQRDDSSFNAAVATFQDATGTPYDDYDTAVACTDEDY